MTSVDLRSCRLYGILDLSYIGERNVSDVAARMIEGGVDILQLRAKNYAPPQITRIAADLHRITSAAGIPLVINDYPEIAHTIGAEGVHVGQDDLPIAEAREIADRNCFAGKSTHSLEQVKRAEVEGADYIGFGPLFATPTKPDYVPIGLAQIKAVHVAVTAPIFCIGGIKLENLREVISAGAERVVIVSGLLQAPDVAEYARAAKNLLPPQPSTLNPQPP